MVQPFEKTTPVELTLNFKHWSKYALLLALPVNHIKIKKKKKRKKKVVEQFRFGAITSFRSEPMSPSLRCLSALLSCLSCRKSRKGKGKGQKRKRKKNRDKTIHDAYVSSAFSTYLHLSVALLIVKLIWEELLCPF